MKTRYSVGFQRSFVAVETALLLAESLEIISHSWKASILYLLLFGVLLLLFLGMLIYTVFAVIRRNVSELLGIARCVALLCVGVAGTYLLHTHRHQLNHYWFRRDRTAIVECVHAGQCHANTRGEVHMEPPFRSTVGVDVDDRDPTVLAVGPKSAESVFVEDSATRTGFCGFLYVDEHLGLPQTLQLLEELKNHSDDPTPIDGSWVFLCFRDW